MTPGLPVVTAKIDSPFVYKNLYVAFDQSCPLIPSPLADILGKTHRVAVLLLFEGA